MGCGLSKSGNPNVTQEEWDMDVSKHGVESPDFLYEKAEDVSSKLNEEARAVK